MSAYRVFILLGLLSALFVGIPDTIIAVYYVRVVGLGPLELVLLGTIVEVVSLIFEVPTGVVADLYSRRLSVLIGVFLVGVCFVGQGLMPVLPAIIAAEAVRGIARAFSSGALEAWIADEIGETAAARAYLRYAQARQVGAIVGNSVGVALASIALWIPVFVGGALMLCLALVLGLVMPERGFSRQHHAEINPMRGALTTFGRGIREVRGRPLLATLLALGFVLAFSTEGLDRLWEAHILRYFTLPTIGGLDSVVWFGAINVSVLVLSVAANQVVRRVVDVTDDRAVARAMVVTSVLRIGGVVVFGLATSFELAAAGYLAHMVFRGVSGPLFTGWINRHIHSSVRATVLSMGGQIDAVGQLTGGPFIGVVAELASLRAAMVAVGATLLPAPALLMRARRRVER